MHSNYMLADLWVMIKAIIVFPLFVFIPGFVAGWLSNAFEFRRRRTLSQLVLSTPLSIALCPILTFWLGRFGGYAAIWVVYGLSSITFLAILGLNWRSISLKPVNRGEVWAWATIAIWMLFAIGSLMHLQFGDKLYYSNAAYDYSVRSPFTAAIMRGIPPSNPFFAAFEPVPLRYHYLWMLMCALPAKLLKEPPLAVMYAGAVWVGIALISTIALCLRFVVREIDSVAQKSVLGAGLLLVTGLDLLPNIYVFAVVRRLLWNPEWWNEVQVTSWANSMLWVPHYLASLIAALTAFLLISEAVRTKGRASIITIALAGCAFASSVGLGVYVTLVFVVFMTLWIALCVSRNWLREAALCLGSGLVAFTIAWPYLISATHTVSSASGVVARTSTVTGKFVELAIRPFNITTDLLVHYGYTDPRFLHFSNLLLLPLNYLLEFGFFLLVGILRWRYLRRHSEAWTREEMACWTLLMSSFVVGSFMTSTTISSNDLGMRSMLPAQFILLLWAVPLLYSWWHMNNSQLLNRTTRVLLASTLSLGLLATAHQVFILRTVHIALDQNWKIAPYFGIEGDSGVETMALRQAFETIDQKLPATARVQTDPANPHNVPQMLFNDHPSAVGQSNCGTGFGGDENRCKPVEEAFVRLFADPRVQDGAFLDRVCGAFSTDALVVGDWDPVWHANTWVWTRPAFYANDHVRVFRCGAEFAALGTP